MADQNAPAPAGFDLEGAIKAGYSDDAILSGLAKAHNFDTDGALKAGYQKADIIKKLAAMPAPNVPNPSRGLLNTPGQAQPDQPKADLPADMPSKAMDAGLTALPYVGAAAAALTPGAEEFAPGILAAAGGGAAGGLIEQLGRTITGIKPPESIGDAAKNIGVDALEQGGNELGGRVAQKVLGFAAGRTIGKYLDKNRLYQSGLKPPGTDPDVANRIVNTGIGEGIRLNDAARPEIQSRVNSLRSQIKGIIQASPADISPSEYISNIQNRLDALRNKWGKVAGEGQMYRDQIDNVEKNFLLENGNPQALQTVNSKGQPITIEPEDMDLATLRQQVGPISAKDAQEIKTNTWEAIRTKNSNAFTPGVHAGLQIRLQKQLAGSMREELENIYPQLHDLNDREGRLMELDRAIGRFIKRDANKQMTPYFIFPPIGAALGALGGGVEGFGAGSVAGALGAHLTRQMLEDPSIKSALAIALDRASKNPVMNAAKAAGAVVNIPNALRAAGVGIDEAGSAQPKP